MNFTATFLFHDSLNDFLSHAKKDRLIKYTFNDEPAIKDSIEAIGVPHTEVAYIIVNNKPADFSYRLKNGDYVYVYPFKHYPTFKDFTPLHNIEDAPKRFILDVHLGKLAKALRLLGFDTAYSNNYNDATIVSLAEVDNRVILTRDIGLLKHNAVVWGYWLRSQYLHEQLNEVINYFSLLSNIQPFSRCLACNHTISAVDKEVVLDKLPPKTIQYFSEFYQCNSCSRVYWKGSHYENMMGFINSIILKDEIKTDNSTYTQI